MPFGKLKYNGDVIVLNDVMQVHVKHLRRACHVNSILFTGQKRCVSTKVSNQNAHEFDEYMKF